MQISLGPIEIFLFSEILKKFPGNKIWNIEFDGIRSAWFKIDEKRFRALYMGEKVSIMQMESN